MDLAFEYAETTPIMSEADYPYKGWLGRSCKYDADKAIVTVKSFIDVTPENPDALKSAIEKGPVSVAIQANKAVFQHYTSGIITSDKCGTNLDHGVLAIGYG